MPEKGIKLSPREEILTYEEILLIADIMAQLGIRKIRLTGGEPLLRENILELTSGLSRIDGVKSLSITTNGILLEEYLEGLKEAGISGINISLDSLDPEKYRKITRGGDVNKVIRSVDKAIGMGFESLKINVVLGSFLDPEDIRDFLRWADDKVLDIRFIEMMPVSGLDQVECSSKNISIGMPEKGIRVESILKIMESAGDIKKVNKIKGYGPAEYYRLKGSRGNIGLIRNEERSCCWCNRIRITPMGLLKLCLFSGESLDLKKKIRQGVSEKKIKDDIISFIKKKPKDRNTTEIDCKPEEKNKIPGLMNKIGG
jgi:cyclic pyranopterin phosphate synthase